MKREYVPQTMTWQTNKDATVAGNDVWIGDNRAGRGEEQVYSQQLGYRGV